MRQGNGFFFKCTNVYLYQVKSLFATKLSKYFIGVVDQRYQLIFL